MDHKHITDKKKEQQVEERKIQKVGMKAVQNGSEESRYLDIFIITLNRVSMLIGPNFS